MTKHDSCEGCAFYRATRTAMDPYHEHCINRGYHTPKECGLEDNKHSIPLED